MMALGGGLLLGAVADVLLPQGMDKFDSPLLAVSLFVAGGVAFFALDRWMARRSGSEAQLIGMLVDYVPESVALGGLVSTNTSLATLLAVVIGLQNIPEGFNAYRELVASSSGKPRATLRFMLLLALLGPTVGLMGHFFLRDRPEVLGGLMLIASGGIMYLMFQEIAPQSRLRNHWTPALGGVIGFAMTLLAGAWIGQ